MQLPPLSKDVLGSRTVTLAVVAFGFALAIAAVSYFVFAAGSGQAVGENVTIHFGPVPVPLRVVVFVLFLLSFVVIWFLLYSQFANEAGDLYSDLRKKLVGNWKVQYELTPGQRVLSQWGRLPEMTCAIALNPVQKLEIHYDVSDNPLFENAREVIQAISLTHDVANRYWLSYYYKMDRTVSSKLSKILRNEGSDHPRTQLEVEVFANLRFEDARTKQPLEEFEGQWYDLNGNLIRLFALAPEFEKPENKDKYFRLSDARVDRENFVALMGNIKFKRIPPAQTDNG
jgi:hypothetical protein